jgi:hypothetical protein
MQDRQVCTWTKESQNGRLFHPIEENNMHDRKTRGSTTTRQF